MREHLIHTTEFDVRFSEADPLGIVWHGHYVRYFEDGREAFGERYGLRYLDLYRNDIVVPIVNINCDYKRILRYGHRIKMEVIYRDTPAAKMLFDYNIFDAETDDLVAKGSSVQVFMGKEEMELMLTLPQFMVDWKKKWLQD